MQTKGWMLLKSLLNKSGHQLSADDFRDMFLSDAPEEEANKILHLEVKSRNPEIALQFPETLLHYIHYSWLIPAIERMPSFLKSRVLGLLPTEQQNRIAEQTEIIPKHVDYFEGIRKKIISEFHKRLDADCVLPKEFLPETALEPLLNLTKNELVTLIDLLGMHDLAEEVRQIVDPKKIKSIYRCLKPHQHRHLYLCLHQQERVISPPLDLGGWNGNCTALQKKLHIRGMIRLGKALSGQHSDMIWHLIHTLDTGRGTILKQYIQEKPIAKVTPALQHQVLQTINYVKNKSPK